jgi:hypothetical protein
VRQLTHGFKSGEELYDSHRAEFIGPINEAWTGKVGTWKEKSWCSRLRVSRQDVSR